MMKYLAVLTLLVGGLLFVPVTEGAEKKTVKLLTIGNSFSRDATWFLKGVVEASGHELVHESIVVGGASLELHATKAQKFDVDAKDREGLYKDGKSLRQHLQAQQWDVVTIQQASIKSHDAGTYRPYAKFLYDYVKKYAPQAEVKFHQTWAYRVDDSRFSPTNTKVGEPLTQKEMYEGVSGAYREVARELGIGLIPVGDAMYLADTDEGWGYREDKGFDRVKAQQPALPDQTHSLHTGWRWAKGKDGKVRLSMDGRHASVAGQFLGACVFYEVLFGDDVTKNTFVPKGMKVEDAAFLRGKAREAVLALKP